MTERKHPLYNEVTTKGLIIHTVIYLLFFAAIVVIFNKYNMSLLNAILLGLMLGILLAYVMFPMVRKRFYRPIGKPTRSGIVRKHVKNRK